MYIKGYNYKSPSVFIQKSMSEIRRQSYLSGNLEFDSSTANYLIRSDEKIMRQDVKGSILIINEMIETLGLKNLVEDVPLYVANGSFVEDTDKYLKRIVDGYKTFEQAKSEFDKINGIYKASPPLLALETLTNSTMSFIAQYTGMKGESATFGNTSISAFYVLRQVKSTLTRAPLAIVSSSHCGGNYSFLTNSSVLGYDEDWKESAGVACLLLGRTNDVVDHCHAKITALKNSIKLPDLETNGIQRSWSSIMENSAADMLIYSGAYTQATHDEDTAYCERINPNVFSWFDDFGNLGPSNIVFGVIKAINYIEEGCEKVDVVDRDIFGRESFIRVEKC